ncbi:MAG: serine hydrolase [Nitrospirae bacterium]|nr:MAG: serine hydrolase [Nitrospirota bacterium]
MRIPKLFNNRFLQKTILVNVVLVPLVIAFFSGWFGHKYWHTHYDRDNTRQVRSGGFFFINPLLECELAKDTIEEEEKLPSKDKIIELIKNKTKDYKLAHVSVYFRDLNNGPWLGINEDEKFAPASLLKVPLMISWLKEAEKNQQLLSTKIEYTKSGDDYNDMLTIIPSRTITLGNKYSVDELIRSMIVYSDNNANTLLFKNTDQRLLKDAYRILGVDIPSADRPADYLSVKSYASFFRILFNASYLNREMSEKALKILSETEFSDGIVAGVPPGIVVAHKFGERVAGANNEIKQLHDCGIVYYPNEPYLLCVMTRGDDFRFLDDIIRDVSQLVFKEMDAHQKGLSIGHK